MIYLVLLLFIFFCAYKYDVRRNGSRSERNAAYYLTLLALVLLSGLRYRIGTDSITYENWFESSGLPTLWNLTVEDFSYNRWEPLFVLFGVVIKTLFGDHWLAFQIIHAIIVNYAFFWGFKTYSRFPFICAGIYFIWLFYPLNCEIMRQSLATAIWIFTLPFLFEKRYIKYFLIVLVCFNIHRGAALFALIPFLGFLQNRKVIIALLVFLLVIAQPLSGFVQDNLLLLVSSMAGENDSGLYTTLMNYSVSTGIEAFDFSLVGTLVFLFNGVIVYLLIASQVLSKKTVKKYGEDELLVDNSYIFYLFVTLQMINLALPIFYRFSWLLSLFPVLFLAEYLGSNHKFKNLKSLIIFVSILFLYSLRILLDYTHKEEDTQYRFYQRFYPYSSVLNPQKNMDRENIYYMYNK